ncbi:major facilitator superfamily domain-containing protein [Xylariaceae sp. FL0662B]|nr:major facilitator superfamily domain-containing protein [Xylariaceae sp. FL0662B]
MKTEELTAHLGFRSRQLDWSWDGDRENPYNWPKWRKNLLLLSTCFIALTGSLGTSIITPAHQQLIEEFEISSTVAFLPLTTYVLALGLGPVVGGPLSETAGRRLVYVAGAFLGGLFALSAGFAPTFSGLSILRFLAGFTNGPSLAIGTGMLAETYTPAERGLPSCAYILSAFLGPGLGPLIGVFLVVHKGWRWTQYVHALFSGASLVLALISSESYHPVIQRRRMEKLGLETPGKESFLLTLQRFLTIGLIRPIHMLFTEPIVGFLCLYVAFLFGVLFIFFGAFFYVFESVYGFTLQQSGLVFLAIALGCVIGMVHVELCNRLFYLPQVKRHPPHQVPPEYRLLPAMMGSIALPVCLFLFAWATRRNISPAVPILAVVIFGVVNVDLFVSTVQYVGDIYHRTNVASAISANSLGRYIFAATFPLFSLQLYKGLGVAWATSILGFVSIALLPLPWVLFKYGEIVRNKSRYQTASY